MVFTPFIGVSVLFHLAVIAWSKVFGSNVGPARAVSEPVRILALIAGYLIITSTFVFVIVGAFVLVRLSLQERHATSYAIESFAEEVSTYAMDVETASAAPLCGPEASHEMSLVDYLNAHNQDSSYEARAVLAKANGIEAYKGSAGQNDLLLALLITKEGSTNIPCIPPPQFSFLGL